MQPYIIQRNFMTNPPGLIMLARIKKNQLPNQLSPLCSYNENGVKTSSSKKASHIKYSIIAPTKHQPNIDKMIIAILSRLFIFVPLIFQQ
jgi:hypothetical protein